MKAIVFLFVYGLATITLLFGQEDQLILANRKNTKKITIEKGNSIKVYESKDSFVSGPLNLLDSATIAVGSDTIALSDIEMIVARTSGTKTGGLIAVSAGVLTLAGGIAILVDANEDSSTDWVPAIRGAGIAMVVIGATTTVFGIGNLTYGKNYTKEKWRYQIR